MSQIVIDEWMRRVNYTNNDILMGVANYFK
jgi:hypothetical protein